MQTFKDIVEVTVVALVIAILVRTLLVEVFVVQGPSMEPTLVDGKDVYKRQDVTPIPHNGCRPPKRRRV